MVTTGRAHCIHNCIYIYIYIYVWIYENEAKGLKSLTKRASFFFSPETISKGDDIKIKRMVSPFFLPVDNYIQRFVGSKLQINEQFTQPKTRNPKHTIKNGKEARLKLQTAARLA